MVDKQFQQLLIMKKKIPGQLIVPVVWNGILICLFSDGFNNFDTGWSIDSYQINSGRPYRRIHPVGCFVI